MPKARVPTSHAPKELFRYVQLKPPAIVDIRARAAGDTLLTRTLAADTAEQRRWATAFLASPDAVSSPAQLKTRAVAHLGAAAIAAHRRPALAGDAAAAGQKTFQADRSNVLRTYVAHRVLGNEGEARDASRTLQLLDAWADPGRAARRETWAPAVLERFQQRPSKTPVDEPPKPPPLPDPAVTQRTELQTLSKQLAALWRVRVATVTAKRAELAEEHRTWRTPSSGDKPANDRKQRRVDLAAKRLQFKNSFLRSPDLHDSLLRSAGDFALDKAGVSGEEVQKLQREVRTLADKYGVQTSEFCQAYEQSVLKYDEILPAPGPPKIVLGPCFSEHPRLRLSDHVRVLGVGNLVRVEETFLRYQESEISYIENVLAGEWRKRQTKDTRTFEQLQDVTEDSSTELGKETSVTTSIELSSQIETELQTQFNSDVNASASGSGGGSIGLVKFDGNGSVNAGLNVGVDARSASENESTFAQEIVSKSVEKVRKATVSRRLQRSVAVYETINRHDIDNRGGENPQNRRGVYCFLDKHVCVSEKVYGARWFLMANLRVPGRNLLCEQSVRIQRERNDLGARPEFTITPDAIQPGTYKDLVGRYHAQNVQPPPAPVARVARTYKTDQASSLNEAQKFDVRGLADILVPFFERYKRFVITDVISLPDGYEVQDVWVTVNHGANGVSVPAHLPITAAGATAFAAPTLMMSVIYPLYLPLGLWQIAYLASPLMHYNVDSSNVTACIGNESQDSPYYFFPPDELIRELFDLFGQLNEMNPQIRQRFDTAVGNLVTTLNNTSSKIPAEMKARVDAALTALAGKVNTVFDKIKIAFDPGRGARNPVNDLGAVQTAMNDLANSVTVDFGELSTLMGDLFTPLRAFFGEIFGIFGDAIEAAMSEFFRFMLDMHPNSQTLMFGGATGTRRELPVSFNTVAIKPGVTINLVACLRRTEQAMDQWRLDTFSKLHNAYLQQLADYESRNFAVAQKPTGKSPGVMRLEEHAAVKELALHTLNNLHAPLGNAYEFPRLNLFEHAIDWPNMSYRVYNYGPSIAQLELDHIGAFKGADDRRRAFLTAQWAQVMIPLQANAQLEAAALAYMESGALSPDFGLRPESPELVELYQALVQERELLAEEPEIIRREERILPTSMVALKLDDRLPDNPDCNCDPLP